MMKKVVFAFLLVVLLQQGFAQPFAKEIAAFKKQDSIGLPPKNAILFVGSSSFRMWTDIQKDFPGHVIINRGFGGSTIPDVIRYATDIITPYKPKQVVIYCGENDFAENDSLQPPDIAHRFIELFNLIRKNNKKVSIAYVSMKPSPSRKALWPRFTAANALIENFLNKQKSAAYINVWDAMLQADGKPVPGIYLADDLHMNKNGYAIWQKIIAPYLLNK